MDLLALDNKSLTYHLLGMAIVCMPILMVGALGFAALVERVLSEHTIHWLIQIAMLTGLVASLSMLSLMLIWKDRYVPVVVFPWIEIESEYHFTVEFSFDRLSVPFVILTFLLCGTIGAFANKYLHREKGFNRFFTLYSIFVLGMIIATLAGSIETLFIGWEMVGLSSALLVAYFHERPSPVRNGLHVWVVYRISDAALLMASVVIHHVLHNGQFDLLLGTVPGSLGWPDGETPLTSNQCLLVGSLLLVAAAGKSALVPFSGWLPRAMEGPTPSSAVFYGALSVHLGAFLLLRFSPLLERSPLLSWLVVTVGVSTILLATLAERVQTDIKSDLSFASLIQVGIIVTEIGFGLRYIALIHIIGHACFRTLQFLRAPTILHDYRVLENAMGTHMRHVTGPIQWYVPKFLRHAVYLFAFEKGFLDALLIGYLANPILDFFRWCDRLERRWTTFLSGPAPVRTETISTQEEPV